MSRQFVFNPLSGEFDVIDVASPAVMLVTAAQNIQQFHAVALDSSGEAYMPDASNITDNFRVLGIAKSAALTGETLAVATEGYLDSGTIWSVGPLYLGEDGVLVSTPATSGFHLQVGSAVSTSRIIVRPESPIILA